MTVATAIGGRGEQRRRPSQDICHPERVLYFARPLGGVYPLPPNFVLSATWISHGSRWSWLWVPDPWLYTSLQRSVILYLSIF